MNAIIENDSTIVTRHPIYLAYRFMKCLLFLGLGLGICGLVLLYGETVPASVVHYLVFPTVLILVNYALVQFVLGIVRYFNLLVVIVHDHITIISSSFLLKEDIEILELSKVMKIDVECHGLLQNLLNFGALIIEQQKNDVRSLHLIPNPFAVLRIIREKTTYLSTRSAIAGNNRRSTDVKPA